MTQARCLYCGRWYVVHPRLWGRQKTCGFAVCKAKHKAALNKKWRAEHPTKQKVRDKKVTARRREEGYWNKWRALRPDYVVRNRDQTQVRTRLQRARRKDAAQILSDPLRFLECLGAANIEMFATQESIGSAARRMIWPRPTMFATQEPITTFTVGMWRYLKAQALFATQEGVALPGAVRL